MIRFNRPYRYRGNACFSQSKVRQIGIEKTVVSVVFFLCTSHDNDNVTSVDIANVIVGCKFLSVLPIIVQALRIGVNVER